jgi:hypothetical protein
MEFVDIGGTPADEDCAAIGITENFTTLNILECRAYIAALQKVYGKEPESSYFTAYSNAHDLGNYREVRYCFDGENPDHCAYMSKVENGLARWDEADFWAPVKYSDRSKPISIIAEIEMLDRAINPKAWSTRARLEADLAEMASQ